MAVWNSGVVVAICEIVPGDIWSVFGSQMTDAGNTGAPGGSERLHQRLLPLLVVKETRHR